MIMMSMAKILQIVLSYKVIFIKCTLKLKSQTDLGKPPYMATLFRKQDPVQFVCNDEQDIHTKNLV